MFVYSDERKSLEKMFENSLVSLIKCKYTINTNYMKLSPEPKSLCSFDRRKRKAFLYAKNKKSVPS